MIEKHGKQASLYRGYRYDRKARKTKHHYTEDTDMIEKHGK